jgi:nucleoside-diphosphate-sugar epimerase
VVCKQLVAEGHDVLATDRRFAGGLPARLVLGDLRDAHAVYPLLEGRDAVVHLGNIPNLGLGPSAQAVLGDNVTMNANVFRAAVDLGVTRIVFASSIQAMIPLEEGAQPKAPYTIPYFPLDGEAPANPGYNFYGLSKEFGERLLRIVAQQKPQLACTALRFPFLANDWFHRRMKEPLTESSLGWCEGLTYLELADAAALVAKVLVAQARGYHQYFPAQALELAGHTVQSTLAEFFPATPLRRPREHIEHLVDLSALERDLGFRPSPALRVQLLPRSGAASGV